MKQNENFEVIYSYTRKQALEDGELVDVTEWASSKKGFIGGFTCPVALTRALWFAIQAIPTYGRGLEDIRGRAHDVLWMASLALRKALKVEDQEALYKMILPRKGKNDREVELLIMLHGGDEGEPVVTIGFPEDF